MLRANLHKKIKLRIELGHYIQTDTRNMSKRLMKKFTNSFGLTEKLDNMNCPKSKHEVREEVNEKQIVLDGKGFYPRRIIIIEPRKKLEYRLVKTKFGKFQLSK